MSTVAFPTLSSLPGVKGKMVHALKNNSQEAIIELINSIVSSQYPNLQEPFFILDLGTVIDLFQTWALHLPFIQPFFPIKCNTDPALISVLAALGANFDCASREEIESVLSLDVNPDRIIYANPCKAESHIEYAATVGVNVATFDSVYELKKLYHRHPTCRLLLRIKPPYEVARSLGKKFGALSDEVAPLLKAAQTMNLSVVGVAFHIGSSATVCETYDAAIKSSRAVFDLAKELGGPKMNILDIGGGFVSGKLFENASGVIKSSIQKHFGDWKNLKVIAEPGRYFSAAAGTLVTCIIGKRIRGKTREYWISDGMYGSMCCIKMDVADLHLKPLKPVDSKTYKSTVFGPTCDSYDLVGSGLQLPEMEVGDWLMSEKMGAYAKAMGSRFNGFSTEKTQVHLANSKSDMHDSYKCEFGV